MDAEASRSGQEVDIEGAAPAYLSLAQAARCLPPGRNGRPTHVATLVRWITGGVKGPNGDLVRLGAIRLGGRWLTSRESLEEFARRLTPSFDGQPPIRHSAARSKSATRAARELDRIGI